MFFTPGTPGIPGTSSTTGNPEGVVQVMQGCCCLDSLTIEKSADGSLQAHQQDRWDDPLCIAWPSIFKD